MRHYGFFRVGVLALAVLFAGCEKREEVSFSGWVVGIKSCEMTYTDMNAGYVVQLETPEGAGGTLVSSTGADTLYNLVVLYEPPKVLKVSSRIHGRFYLDEKYSRANGCVMWRDENIENLPEGVFTEVVVD